MDKIKWKKTIKIAMVSILALAMLLGCVGIIFGQSKVVDAYTISGGKISTDEAITIDGFLKSGYESLSGNRIFDEDVFWDIITKISGVASPDESTLTNLGKTPITAQNIRDRNGSKDIIITIGGKKWMAAYVSQNNKNEPILTLYLATVNDSTVKKAQFNKYDTATAGDFPANMYGTSYMRAKVLNNGGDYATSNGALTTAEQDADNDWAIYTMEKSAEVPGSIAKFIEVPDNMSWQHVQKAKEHVSGSSYGNSSYFYNNANDALDKGIESLSNNYDNKEGYTNWKNDKIWLPSFTETGIVNTTGMWKLAVRQRIKNNGDYVWSRSARAASANSTYSYYSSGNDFNANDAKVKKEHGVAPAFHLNLKTVANTSLDEPFDIENPYNGLPQDLSNITDKNKLSWYVSSIMSIDYPPTEMKEVGTYPIKVTITSADPKDKFAGTPEEGTDESEKVRYFNYKITKKKIGVDLSLVNKHPQAAHASGAICSGDTVANGRAPVFGFTYKKVNGGQTYTEYPTGEIGEFIATVEITNDCSYELDPDTTLTIGFTIDKALVQKPKIATLESPYTGSPIPFNLSQTNDIDKVNVDVSSTASYENNTVTATNAGKYTVTFSLKDNGAATCWDSETSNDIAPYTIEINITAKNLNPTITCSDADASWDVGETTTMTITDERVSGANIDYYVYYLKSGDNTKYDDINSTKVVNGNGVTITMPNNLAIGSYTFVVELSASKDSDNGNYFINGDKKEKSFTVVGGNVAVNDSSIKWQVNSADIGELTDGKLILTYNGNAYKFSVDDSNLKDLGVKIDTSKGGGSGLEGDIEQTNAKDLYQVTVFLCNYDNTYETWSGSFTLKYQIEKAKYKLGEVKWNYDPQNPFKYNGNNQTIKLINLPITLTVSDENYDNNKKRNVGDYEASVLGFDNSNDNYITPLVGKTDTYDGDFEWSILWKIVKATLNLEWTYVQLPNMDFKVWQVTGDNAQYVDNNGYKYFKSAGLSVGDEIALKDIEIGDGELRYWV
ncbi:MAG: hypothetical protein K2M75_03100, partial [Clostridia bacterium]|nr:hypothetical protein [Clostridia bacterium]